MTAVDPVLFIRGGGLGDFILSLPLLRVFHAAGRPIRLIARKRHWVLLPQDCPCDRFMDLDGAAASSIFAPGDDVDDRVAEHAAGADVYLFTKADPVVASNLRAAGAKRIFHLRSRPTSPPHVAKRFFIDAGLEPPPNLFETPIWEKPTNLGSDLWIHPGSGSSTKNLPPATFAEFAVEWRHHHDGGVIVSFGEADEALIKPIERAFHEKGIVFEVVVNPTLAELMATLRRRAAHYAGNDSGVSHLAAGLGVPSTVFFKTTDPAIWRPLGTIAELRIPFEVKVPNETTRKAMREAENAADLEKFDSIDDLFEDLEG